MATNRLVSSNGVADAPEGAKRVQYSGQDVAELRHKAEQSLIEVLHARRQLQQWRDIGRADAALEVAEQTLRGIVG